MSDSNHETSRRPRPLKGKDLQTKGMRSGFYGWEYSLRKEPKKAAVRKLRRENIREIMKQRYDE